MTDPTLLAVSDLHVAHQDKRRVVEELAPLARAEEAAVVCADEYWLHPREGRRPRHPDRIPHPVLPAAP